MFLKPLPQKSCLALRIVNAFDSCFNTFKIGMIEELPLRKFLMTQLARKQYELTISLQMALHLILKDILQAEFANFEAEVAGVFVL